MELGLALSTALGNELGNGLGTLFGFSATCKSHFTVGDDVGESVSLHFFLQVDGQFFLIFNQYQVISFHISFLESHGCFALPFNWNESKFSQALRLTVGEGVGESVLLPSLMHRLQIGMHPNFHKLY